MQLSLHFQLYKTLVDRVVLFQSACSYIMRNSDAKNSNVISEGDQTLCDYKRGSIKKSPAILPLYFLYYVVFLRI